MSRRVEKLYQRLDALEREYRQIAARDLARTLRGGHPWVIGSMIALWGKRWRKPEQQHFEQIEKEIISIREKMNEPLVGSPVHDLRTIRRRYEELLARRGTGWHTEHARPLVKSVLEEWKKQMA